MLGVLVTAATTSARGAFTSQEKLMKMSALIGTKNPVTARVVCFIGLFFFTACCIGVTGYIMFGITNGGWGVFVVMSVLEIVSIAASGYTSYRKKDEQQPAVVTPPNKKREVLSVNIPPELADQMTKKSDAELQLMFAREEEWTPQALGAARAELQKRNIVIPE